MIEKFIPYITTGIALAAFFAALYFRSVRDFARQNIESIKSLTTLPSAARLEAMKVVINTFDLDTKNLTAAQQYKLAMRTFEKREADSRRGFLTLLIVGGLFAVLSLVALVFSQNSPAMVAAAVSSNRSGVAETLRRLGFFEDRDPLLLDKLGREIPVAEDLAPYERALKFEQAVKDQPLLAEMRRRSSRGEAPFQQVGEILNTGVPARVDQPPRYIAYVQRGSPVAGSVIEVRGREADRYLRLWAKGGIDNGQAAELQLNQEQYVALVGDKLRSVTVPLYVRATKYDDVYDPTCPRGAGFALTNCDLPAKRLYRDIPDILG